MAEVLIYGGINSYQADKFITALGIAGVRDDVTIRLNSDGGDVRMGWGMLTKLAEQRGDVTIINDCEANSMAAFFACYAKKGSGICADYATYGFHRAALPSWMEENPDQYPEEMAFLDRVNGYLRKAAEAKMEAEAFKNETDTSYDELFSMKGRKMVTLTAKQAKKLGLVDQIIAVTPEKKQAISAEKERIMAEMFGIKIAANTQDNSKSKQMDLIQLKADHPATHAAVIKAERDRCNAWTAWIDVDPAAVKEGIESGNEITQAQVFAFMRKGITADQVKKVEGENAATQTTGATNAAADGSNGTGSSVEAHVPSKEVLASIDRALEITGAIKKSNA